jgi:hypothetical protein
LELVFVPPGDIHPVRDEIKEMKKGIFYLSIASIVYVLTFAVSLPDYDLWARLFVGSIFFQTGHVLNHDIFSYLPTKALWIDHEWGSGVVFYFFAKYLGDSGLFVLKALILLATFIFIINTIELRKDKDHDSAGIFYFIFLTFSLLPGIAGLIRCQMFSYLFFTLWVYALEKIRREENKYIWIFPVTTLFWVNMHGGFLAGMGLIIIYAIGELLNRRNALKYFGILALIIPVTLINPYGFKFWHYIIEAVTMSRPYIPEWQPINLSGPFHIFAGIKIHALTGFVIFAVLTLVACAGMLKQKEKSDRTMILLVILLLYSGVRHQRHAEFFILAVSGLFYHQYIDLFNPVREYIKNHLTGNTYKIWATIRYGFGYILIAAMLIYSIPKLSYSIVVDPFVYPVGSMEFIKQNHISGNLATSYDWGSYAFWILYPQCKVLIDGRYEEVYFDEIYDIAVQFSEHKGDWQAVLRYFHADILVLSKRKYSQTDISTLKDWKLVYQDRISAVLLPKDRLKPFYLYPDYRFKERPSPQKTPIPN